MKERDGSRKLKIVEKKSLHVSSPAGTVTESGIKARAYRHGQGATGYMAGKTRESNPQEKLGCREGVWESVRLYFFLWLSH